ncbi:hypothetical protein QCN27_06845 [Cereibacter sp. SYSU M97828]|nr:hypothetical protein [Cereibacter flavus]
MFSKRAFLAVIVLAGCNPPQDPLPYSPNYHYTGGQAGLVHKGYASRRAMLPDACVTPDVQADAMYLPSGCANNLNLQQMVANQGDLMRGRMTGPAMGAPAARAARRVIDGTQPDPEPLSGETLTTTRQPIE